MERQAERDDATEWTRQNAEGSIDAINQFERSYNQFQFGGLTFQLAPARQSNLSVGGVEISVNLDVLVVTDTPRHGRRVGGVLFRMSRGEQGESEPARDRRHNFGLYVATLVHRHVGEHFTDLGEVHRPYCFAVDVRYQEAHRTPNNYLRRLNQIEAACEMITAMWDRIGPPADL